MADQRYVVGISFQVDDLASKLTGIASRVPANLFGSQMGSQFANAFTGAVEKAADVAMTLAKVGVGAGVAAATYGVVSLNSELEKTQIALADIFTANGVSNNLTQGMGMAADMMQQIRKDAAALPGETRDLAQIFKMAAIPGIGAGASPQELEKLSANAMAFGMGVANMDSGTVARELSMLISGRAGSHNVLGLQLAGLGGDKAEAFNKMSASDRLATLSKEFEKHAGSIKLFSDSFEGLSSTLKDNVKLFMSTATKPLFDSVKSSLGAISNWFDSNQGTVGAWAQLIGRKLNDAWGYGVEAIQTWWPAIESFARTAESAIVGMWERVKPLVESVGETIRKFMTDGKAFDRIETILKLYAAVKLGGMVANSGAVGLASGAGKALLGAGGGAGEALALGAGVEAMGVAALVAIPALVTIGGALHDLLDPAAAFHNEATKIGSDIELRLNSTLKDMAPTLRTTESAAIGVADALGVVMLGALDQNLIAINGYVSGLKWATDKVNSFFGGKDAGFNSLQERAETKAKEFAQGRDALTGKPGSLQPKTGAGGGGGGTVIHVQMTVAGNESPSRVARVVMQKIAELNRYPTSSKNAPNYLAGR